MFARFVLFLGLFSLSASAAWAELCDYRLSEVIARRGAAGAIDEVRAAAGADVGPVIYIVVNPRTGATNFGATGNSEDDGLFTRSARILGLAANLVGVDSIVAAGSAAVGAGLEAVCFLRDERITDHDDVLEVLRRVDMSMPPDLFALIEPEGEDAFIRIARDDGVEMEEYKVEDLYVVNGQLRHRERGRDEVLGDIAIFIPQDGE